LFKGWSVTLARVPREERIASGLKKETAAGTGIAQHNVQDSIGNNPAGISPIPECSPCLFQQPNGNAGPNDAWFSAAHVSAVVNARKGIANFLDNPLQDLRILAWGQRGSSFSKSLKLVMASDLIVLEVGRLCYRLVIRPYHVLFGRSGPRGSEGKITRDSERQLGDSSQS
jgi:hypothetical protein